MLDTPGEEGRIMKKLLNIAALALIGLAGGLLELRMLALPGLVGIINNSRNAEISIPGAIDKNTGNPITVQAQQPYYFAAVNIPDNSESQQNNRFDNGLVVQVKIDTDSGTQIYPVMIAQTGVFQNQFKIEAKAESGGNKIIRDTRVTNAVNGGKIVGFPPSPWQGIIVAFNDKAVADTSNDLPFDFAISAWTSNRDEWCNEDQYFLKTNQAISFDDSPDGKEYFSFKDKAGKPQYLTIIQGQQALGGGVVPRPKYAHLVHIYNNTGFGLHLKRVLGTGKGDTILIPPQCVFPYVMEWVPVVTAEDLHKQGAARPGIQIAVLRSSKPRPPSIDEALLTGAAGIKSLPTETDVNDILNNMGLSTPDKAAKVMDIQSIQQLMKPAQDYQFFAIKTIYKMWVPESLQRIKIVSRDVTPGLEDVRDVEVLTSADPAFVDYTHPGYFSLIVTEGKDSKNPLQFKLTKLKVVPMPFVK